MNFLSQSRFPKLWLFFQYLIGGTVDKRRFSIMKYSGQRNVLEIGCSAGNIAEIFKQFSEVQYTGIDIDFAAINCAKEKFKHYPNFSFVCEDISQFVKTAHKYDYILIANTCHHIANEIMEEMLSASLKLLSEKGSILIVDLILPNSQDRFLVRNGYKIDQGKHIKTDLEIKEIIGHSENLKLMESEILYLGATPFSMPKIAKIGLYHVCAKKN